jgi:hypothetical protein
VNNRGGLSAARAIRRGVERCDGFVDALYLLAVLHRGDLRLAEEAVIDAIASAAIDPLINASDAFRTWQLLATHFHAANEQSVFHGSPQALVREAELSIAQRETMALIASGREADEVAALLGVPTAQVHDEFRRGTQALQAAMTSLAPKPPRGDRPGPRFTPSPEKSRQTFA